MDILINLHHLPTSASGESDIKRVSEIIQKVDIKIEYGCATKLRREILDELLKDGWSTKIKLSIKSQITLTAMKDDIGLCLQTGNMSRFYADLLKVQYLFCRGTITTAIYILPTKRNAKVMGQNMANYNRLVQELDLYKEIITAPIFVIGIN